MPSSAPDCRVRSTTSRLDLRAAARHPAPVIDRALVQTGQSRAALDAAVRALGITVEPGMPPRDLERLLMALLPPERPATPPSLHPTELPLSLAFRASQPGDENHSPGSLKPVYDAGFDRGFKAGLRDRAGDTCDRCGAREGDLYVHASWRKGVQEAPSIKMVGRMAVAHPASDPSHLSTQMQVLCSACHQHLDRAHIQSAAVLTSIMLGTLTQERFEARWESLRAVAREATEQGGRPLGALQVGGADLLLATLLHLGESPTPAGVRRVMPELADEPADDIRTVMRAARVRLELRGLLAPGEWRLTRAFLPAPRAA